MNAKVEAQEAQEARDPRSTEFVPVEGGGEATSAATMLVLAYIIAWCVLFGFVLTSWRRQRQIDLRLDQVERALRAREDAG